MSKSRKSIEFRFKKPALLHWQIVEHPVATGVEDQNLLFHRERRILRLFQNLHQAAAAIQLGLRNLVQFRAEQRERRQIAILRQIQTKRAGHLPHGLDLRAAADAAD